MLIRASSPFRTTLLLFLTIWSASACRFGTTTSWFLGMAKQVRRTRKTAFTWTLFTLIWLWVRPPSRLMRTWRKWKALSQRAALGASQIQKKWCRQRSKLLVGSQTWTNCSPWKLKPPSYAPTRPKAMLENLCSFVIPAAKAMRRSWLSKFSIRAQSCHIYCERPWASTSKSSGSQSNATDIIFIRAVLIITLCSTLESDDKWIEIFLIIDGVYKELKASIQVALMDVYHWFLA